MKLLSNNDVVHAIQTRNITHFPLLNCSQCNTALYYIINPATLAVGFDSNCVCVPYMTDIARRNISDLTEHFNRQTPEISAVEWERFLACGNDPTIPALQNAVSSNTSSATNDMNDAPKFPDARIHIKDQAALGDFLLDLQNKGFIDYPLEFDYVLHAQDDGNATLYSLNFKIKKRILKSKDLIGHTL